MPDVAATAIMLVKDRSGVTPASAYDAALMAEQPIGAQFEAKPMKARSLPQLRMYWAMLTNLVDATALGDRYPTPAKLHDAILRELGYVSVSYDLASGKPYVTRDSTAFDKMTADEFRVFFDRATARLSEIVGADVLQTEAA